MTKANRLPLPKRFNAAMTEEAYAGLRALNEDWHFGNNYLLTILLENFDRVVDQDAFEEVMNEFIAEYGQPVGGGMG
ncbi:hypothetical protein [uncultured Tateyamaria sp.]|uniref:hypothetical protein n=1 Tax=uncultured Tateyamaria sp. TaxID=455651 RepID=UPI00262A4ADA|nr:hypothetical protein [uncultured Tateyamaria sp.]